jgi:predicted Fe-Mo cluster-binding NifX family protein
MKICIPTQDDRGLEARLSDHFGSAPFFTFFDTATGRLEVAANTRGTHEPGQCDPAQTLESTEARVVVCRGLGRRALERLQQLGVEVFVTRQVVARQALEAHAAGRLPILTRDAACGGHEDCEHHAPGVTEVRKDTGRPQRERWWC